MLLQLDFYGSTTSCEGIIMKMKSANLAYAPEF